MIQNLWWYNTGYEKLILTVTVSILAIPFPNLKGISQSRQSYPAVALSLNALTKVG
jgi:hypothetical protein